MSASEQPPLSCEELATLAVGLTSQLECPNAWIAELEVSGPVGNHHQPAPRLGTQHHLGYTLARWLAAKADQVWIYLVSDRGHNIPAIHVTLAGNLWIPTPGRHDITAQPHPIARGTAGGRSLGPATQMVSVPTKHSKF